MSNLHAIEEGSKVINCDWVNHLTCRLTNYIYMKPNTFVAYDIFLNRSEKSGLHIFF